MPVELPIDFIHKMETLLQSEAPAFFSSLHGERTAGLRINPLKVTPAEWEVISPFALEKIPFVENGYYYNFNQEEPGKYPYHQAGVYYIQEPSAMFIAGLIDAKPGEKILDLCAAPGGKSTQIGAAMKNQGILVSNEVYPKRAKVLSENIERFGIQNAIVTNETPEKLAKHFPFYFDKILVDAPCSGEGMFRKDLEAAQYWSQEHVLECQSTQLDILDQAYAMLKDEGYLVYSTCTFSPEEDEQVIEKFIHKYPDMELIEIEKSNGIADGRPEWTLSGEKEVHKCGRLWPHHLRGEGHFAAKLKKTAPTPKVRTKVMKVTTKLSGLKDYELFKQRFLQNTDFRNLVTFGSQLHAMPLECPDLNGLKVVRAGLHLGELKKNRFEPNHALALSLQKDQAQQTVTLKHNDNRWLDYLKGMTLKDSGDSDGWVLVTIDNFPLGWGKASNGIIKNLYPKGLRIMG